MTHSRFRTAILVLALGGLLSLPIGSVAAQPTRNDADGPQVPLVYKLSIPAPNSHRFHIRIAEMLPPAAAVEFALPAWTPGYYQILDFQTDIENVRATDASGHPLPVGHSAPRLWSIKTTESRTAAAPFFLDYDVNAHDPGLGFFGSTLDAGTQRGYINGASAFLYETANTRRPIRLETSLPAGWKAATPLSPALPAAVAAARGATEAAYEAESYDVLIDSPLQLGQFTTAEFDSDGAAFECVVVGSSDWDRPKVTAVLKKIVHAGIQIFGRPPFKRYIFFYHIGGAGFTGGLEHRDATVIHLGLPLKDGKGNEFQTVSSHEFFHAWNVKRLRPVGLGPFDYTQPVRTASLWWAEGVTDYYADLLLYRAGLRDMNWLLNDLADRIAELDNTPARLRVSLEEASRKAWEGQSEGFGGLSYYLKGSLVGLYFDLRLRELTGGRRNMDDVMRLLDTEYAAKDRAYPEDALLRSLETVSQTDLHAEYADLVRSHGEIDWETVAARAGLTLRRDSSPYLGVRVHAGTDGMNEGLIIDSVEVDSAAARSALRAGDLLMALNGTHVTLKTFKDQLTRLAPRSPITLRIVRSGKPLTLVGDAGQQYTHHTLTLDPNHAGPESPVKLFLPSPPAS